MGIKRFFYSFLTSIRFLFLSVFFVLTLSIDLRASDSMEEAFLNPPAATQPRCYWYWMKGNISKEGITKDLEAMKRVGIGEAYIGVIEGGKVSALSEEWWQMIEHAVREATRIGVDIGLFNCPGWSQSGGPWIKPQQSMRFIVLSEQRFKGPQKLNILLPPDPRAVQDLAVIAFPAPAKDNSTAMTQGAKLVQSSKVFSWALPKPFKARSLVIQPKKPITGTALLEVSEDGVLYRTVKKFPIERKNMGPGVGPVPLAPFYFSFPPTTAPFFRLTFSSECDLVELVLSEAPRLESLAEKSLIKLFEDPQPPFDYYRWAPQVEAESKAFAIDPEKVVNLSSKMNADGVLTWDLPEGEWVILRTGLAPTGTQNSPAPVEATGPEVDKMSRSALKVHFDSYVGKLLARMPEKDRKSWKHVIADSYEQGAQNWTDELQVDFKKRYGYDPLLFLPVMTGRIVGSALQSDRFLWDLRRLIADRISEDYVGGLSDFCKANGLKMWLENYGHWGFPGEFLQYGGKCDEISGEFWEAGDLGLVELRPASSAAHIYGKNQVFAEAWTGGPPFRSTPWSLKKRGDWALCNGINQFVLHVYIHQPWEDRLPGMNAWFGTEFNRHNTWFEASKSWIDYLRRCTVLLQQGKSVADVAYFIGEDAPRAFGLCNPALPDGYDFDYINAEVLLNYAKVKNKSLVLESGASYKMLVLPAQDTMTPEMLKKISEFAKAGLTVCGPRPVRSPSLKNYPDCDQKVKSLAAELWDKGAIVPSEDLKSLLIKRSQTPPDLDGVNFKEILFTHRRTEDADIYFLSNQTDLPMNLNPTFRVIGRIPELWHPDSGEREPVESYQIGAENTRLSLQLDPRGSLFVVFRGKATSDKTLVTKEKIERPASESILVKGPWQVTFPGKSKAVPFASLISWTTHPDAAVKYFSGTATYRTTFEAPMGLGKEPRVLDLGGVENLAQVTLNGHSFRWLWKPPFQLNIAEFLKPGVNELEVQVVNTWHNRLVGQNESPGSFTGSGQFKPWTSEENKLKGPLIPAGLMGPVLIR